MGKPHFGIPGHSAMTSLKAFYSIFLVSILAGVSGSYVVEDNNPRIQYVGQWILSSETGSSGGTEHRTNVPGSSAILSNFTGASNCHV